jgi:hypothetical protein
MNGMNVQPIAGDWIGWSVVIAGAIGTIWTIGISIYWVIKPGEHEPDHPKRLIMRKDR